jgi:quercetin dioxygenase-like cupin family protein
MKKILRVLPFVLCLAGFLAAQTENVVDIADESHHHLLLENEKVRVFEVDLPAHQSTPHTRHDHNYIVITVEDSEVASWAEGQSGVITYQYQQNDIRFFFGGPARALRNDTPYTYHNLTIEFLNPKVTTLGYAPKDKRWEYGSSALLPPADPQKAFANTMDLGEAKVKDVQLLPDDVYPEPEKDVDELLIALAEVELKKGAERIRKSQGEALWIPAGRKIKLVNDATVPARMVIMELK